jgi:hypothetical protein
MNQQPIYELAVHPAPVSSEFRPREPSVIYFSNLKKTIECITGVLVLHGWEPTINYSAVYRNLKLRDRFQADFSVQGVVFFRVVITKRVLNPVLPSLAIDDRPRVR